MMSLHLSSLHLSPVFVVDIMLCQLVVLCILQQISLATVTSSRLNRPITASVVAKDYCQWETFNATCQHPDHVILMTSARYGRMADGRCVNKNYGGIGCAVDVLTYTDSRCSGRTHCSITVADISVHGIRPCPADLTSYFEAAYRCVPVELPNEQPCSQSMFTPLTSLTGYLSSVQPSSRMTSPMSNACRWLIEAEPGRRINLTVYDFTAMTSSSSSDLRAAAAASVTSPFCRRLAVIRDTESGQETNICSRSERVQVLASAGHRLEITIATTFRQRGSTPLITMATPSSPNNVYFLIRYDVTGCSKLSLPTFPAATVEISTDGQTAVVECDVTGHVMRWMLKCINSEWQGDVGNCTLDDSDVMADEFSWTAILPNGWTSPYGVVVVISLGVLFGLIIGSTLLAVAVCLLKWKRRSIPRHPDAPPTDDEVHYTPGCHVISAGGTQKRGDGYCDCTWSPHELLQRTSLIWHPTDTTNQTDIKTYGRTGSTITSTSGRHTLMTSSSNMATPDLFADDSSQSGLAGSISADVPTCSLSAGATPRIVTTHFYESPIFSHRERLLNNLA